MQIKGDGYGIDFDHENNTVGFKGSFRLENIGEYEKIKQLLSDVHELNLSCLKLDFREVDFLNSSGIAMLCKFIMEVKKIDKMPVIILGNEKILWQKKSFQNLKLLWDKVDVEFSDPGNPQAVQQADERCH